MKFVALLLFLVLVIRFIYSAEEINDLNLNKDEERSNDDQLKNYLIQEFLEYTDPMRSTFSSM